MKSTLGFVFFCFVLTAYYIYIPLPHTISEPWKLMMLDATFRGVQHLGNLAHSLGLSHHIRVLNFAVTFFGMLSPTSSEGVRVTDTVFDGVQVRVFEATRGSDSELKRSVVYIHGGGWSLGSARMQSYDYLCRKMAEDLNAVVVSVDYRLAPEVHFPEQYNDAYLGTKHFLLPEVLAKYSVDPNRVAVSGDSAGGNLAAAVSQQECPQCPLHFQPWLTVSLEATKTKDDTSYSVRTGHKHRLTSPTARDCKQSKENSNGIHTVEAMQGNICQVFSGNFPSE